MDILFQVNSIPYSSATVFIAKDVIIKKTPGFNMLR